jgi:transposase InsO family protein
VLKDLREAGERVSKKTFERAMARQGLVVRRHAGLVARTRPDKRAVPAPDLVNRDFSAERPDEKWRGDPTEIPTHEGKLYLATVEDLCLWRLVGFAVGDHHDAELAAGAVKMAVAVRGADVAGVIFHSDQGS